MALMIKAKRSGPERPPKIRQIAAHGDGGLFTRPREVRKTYVNVRLTEAQYQRVESEAKRRGLSISDLLREALEKLLA